MTSLSVENAVLMGGSILIADATSLFTLGLNAFARGRSMYSAAMYADITPVDWTKNMEPRSLIA